MTDRDLISRNARLLDEAAAAGRPFHLAVTLSYVGGTSDKRWTGVFADQYVAVNYGLHYTEGQFLVHDMGTREKAAAKMWALLRDKVGKGYTVADAAIMITDVSDSNTLRPWAMVRTWDNLRAARAKADRPMLEPDTTGKSSRTGKQGAQVLLDLTTPGTSEDTLMSIWDCVVTERFLAPIVLSHPNCPEMAQFMTALSANGVTWNDTRTSTPGDPFGQF